MIITETFALIIIFSAVFLALLFGIINACIVKKISLLDFPNDVNGSARHVLNNQSLIDKIPLMEEISMHISDGSKTFLKSEYKYIFIFMVVFAVTVALAAQQQIGTFWTTIAFLCGGLTSILSGYIGMRIAVAANIKTAKQAFYDLGLAFTCAFRAGAVMGFTLVGLGLLVLTIIILVYKRLYQLTVQPQSYQKLFECVAGYGLGGSSIALFCRVGGGIYTKAADMGADLVGKVIENLDEDSIKNPGVIADNVGDNVGDIAGMGSDLFGSFAEATCACLVISSSSKEIVQEQAFYYPLLITASGIFVSFITSFFATNCMRIRQSSHVERVLKFQLIISTLLETPVLLLLSYGALPKRFFFTGLVTTRFSNVTIQVRNYQAFVCTVVGLWGGLLIGFLTQYYTSNSHAPVREVAQSCTGGAAPSIIHGLALGYNSTILAIIVLCAIIFTSFSLAEMYGIALAALGMLSNMSIALTIDAYGPIADNAGGIAEMVELSVARQRTDALDAAGNTTAAIGKGFAIGSALLVALALFGAFVTRTKLPDVNILRPLQFAGLVFGAMLPYAFSAWTMKSTGIDKPDYERCIAISTRASLRQMVAPALLVIITPIAVGFCFGAEGVSGVLAGAIASSVQMAIAFSNSGGAWDNAKKYIEGGKLMIQGQVKGKWSSQHQAAVIGDTVGDPLKDTSGPSLNILIKLMAIISLVFGDFFIKTGYLVR